MSQLLTLADALKNTEGNSRSLMIGNGFSIKHFSYKKLFDAVKLPLDSPVRSLFDALRTFDFEVVIRGLEDASIVEIAYKNERQSKIFQKDADELRETLVKTIRETHPPHREDIEEQIPARLTFLKNFQTVFTLNYDLLLYWIMLADTTAFQDGFGLGQEADGFRGPFKEAARCNVFNLHGGLHLFKTGTGEIEKQLMGTNGVIDAIANTITAKRRLPVYVAEASTTNKMLRINSIPYLRHCYGKLRDTSGVFFVYGHSADSNDAHIYLALFNSKIEHLYFCIHQPTAKLNEIDGELARYKKLSRSKIRYSFVDSESVPI